MKKARWTEIVWKLQSWVKLYKQRKVYEEKFLETAPMNAQMVKKKKKKKAKKQITLLLTGEKFECPG